LGLPRVIYCGNINPTKTSTLLKFFSHLKLPTMHVKVHPSTVLYQLKPEQACDSQHPCYSSHISHTCHTSHMSHTCHTSRMPHTCHTHVTHPALTLLPTHLERFHPLDQVRSDQVRTAAAPSMQCSGSLRSGGGTLQGLEGSPHDVLLMLPLLLQPVCCE
jgi:hypothetical protein